MPRHFRRTVTAVAAAAVLALGAAGCSGDSEDAPEEGSAEEASTVEELDPEVAAALEQAVRDYTAAFFAPDAEAAYALISERCQAATDLESYTERVELAAQEQGRLTVQSLRIEEAAEDTARVSYSVGVPTLDERLTAQPWALEDDSWVFDAC
jgi:hypothetical protein